ncbi:putative membrane protein, partial [Clostridioides difficile DA00305]
MERFCIYKSIFITHYVYLMYLFSVELLYCN